MPRVLIVTKIDHERTIFMNASLLTRVSDQSKNIDYLKVLTHSLVGGGVDSFNLVVIGWYTRTNSQYFVNLLPFVKNVLDGSHRFLDLHISELVCRNDRSLSSL